MATSARSFDLALAITVRVGGAVARPARQAGAALTPLRHLLARPPLLPERLQPAMWAAELELDGARRRAALTDGLAKRLDVLVPRVVDAVLRRLMLTELVLRYVDVDTVVAAADLDAAVARVDVGSVVDRVDVDAVAGRLDLDAVLDRLDLTALVLQRVDLQTVVDAVLARIDLPGLAEDVIDEIDLPEIIRESTGSMASDSVWQARMQGVAADEAVSRVVDRILLRRRERATRALTEQPVPEQRRPEGPHDDRDR